MLDGDTDTNAAIVGGLIGAKYGLKGIPEDWVSKVINCENKRPDFLRTKNEEHIYGLIDQLLEKAPSDVDFADNTDE